MSTGVADLRAAATRLAPAHLRPWRCHCGNRHPALAILCPYTNQPRDHR